MKILVVDDSEFAPRRIKTILEAGSHEIVEAESGEEALRLLVETEPQAATVDILKMHSGSCANEPLKGNEQA